MFTIYFCLILCAVVCISSLLWDDQYSHRHGCIYSVVRETIEFNGEVESVIPYCLQETNFLSNSELECYGKEFSFIELKQNGISSLDLFEWHATIETISNYQAYLLGENLNDTQKFCRCPDSLWFGPNCEYTLVNSNSNQSFDDIVYTRFKMKNPLNNLPFEPVSNSLLSKGIDNDDILSAWKRNEIIRR